MPPWFSCSISIFALKKLRTIGFVLWAGIFFQLTCCHPFSVIPVTVKEVKDYAVGRQQSFSYPIGQVLKAAVHNLIEMNFVVLRIEHFNGKGVVYASWQKTSASVLLETITPKLTKVTCKIFRGSSSREYSSEDALLDSVREILKHRPSLDWGKLVEGMASVHFRADTSSAVIAYLSPGAEAELIKAEGEWGKIALMDDCSGYMFLRHLRPAKGSIF